jgi:6-phosphogluconolactonase
MGKSVCYTAGMTALLTIDAGTGFVQKASELIGGMIRSAIREHGSCTVGLSGGSTPGPVYQALAKEAIDWNRVTFFLVDDRCVSPDHPDSNQLLARTTIVNATGAAAVFPNSSLPPEESATDYADRLGVLLDRPIDVNILGMGPDGHITSLFPPVPDTGFGDAIAIHTQTPLDENRRPLFAVKDRITLTLPVLAAATQSVFLMKSEKKQLWEEMLASEEDERRWPAKGIIASSNVTVIFG